MRFVHFGIQNVQKAQRKKRKLSTNYKRTSALSKQMSRAAQIHLVKGIRTFKKKVSREDMQTAWERGNYQDVMRIIPWTDLHEDTKAVAPDLFDTILGAATFSIDSMPGIIRDDLRFDVKNPKISNFVYSRTGELVTNIQSDTQKIIQGAVTRSLNEALTPRGVADLIVDSIGLYPRQEQALRNFNKGLLYKNLPAENVQKYSHNYADRLLDQRAMMIARTETRYVANYGQLFVWKEAQNSGLISEGAKKVWIVDGDPCEICDPMDGEEVGLAEAWILSNGDVVDVPNESHPNCLCGMEINMADTEEKIEENTPDEQEEEAE